jgi:Tol biopolymer transport system component
MNIDNNIKTTISWILFLLLLILCAGCSTPEKSADIQSEGRPPSIHPEYSGIVIPPNIAPLNFFIQEAGEEFIVRIHSKQGDPIRVRSGSGNIQIPMEPWKRLLAENLGQQLILNIFVKNQAGQWTRFDSVINQIAYENIDGYLAYRKFGPLFNQWKKMGIFQRCLENFDEKPIFFNQLTTYKHCMNCHNFYQNGTERWILHTRFGPGTAMLLTINDVVKKIDTRTKLNKSPGGYPAWHPSGELIAFSSGPPTQFFHTMGETRDELDRALDIILYDIRTNTVSTNPQLSSKERVEVWPVWTPDGRYLFFCGAPKLETFFEKSQKGEDSLAFDKIQYDLMRISYNHQNGSWGELETVVPSKEFGWSIAEPKISPDGRFLVFTASRYGSFPIFHSDADLYLLDLTNGRQEKLALNSDRAEGYHSWSSNSRWLVFSSKREDTQFTRLYLSHIDSSGNASKAFILPQKDPLFYDTYLEIYNVPELIKEPVRVSPQALMKAAEQEALNAKLDSNVISSRITDKTNSADYIKTPLNQRKKNHIKNGK